MVSRALDCVWSTMWERVNNEHYGQWTSNHVSPDSISAVKLIAIIWESRFFRSIYDLTTRLLLWRQFTHTHITKTSKNLSPTEHVLDQDYCHRPAKWLCPYRYIPNECRISCFRPFKHQSPRTSYRSAVEHFKSTPCLLRHVQIEYETTAGAANCRFENRTVNYSKITWKRSRQWRQLLCSCILIEAICAWKIQLCRNQGC